LVFVSLQGYAQDEEGDVYDPFIDYSEFEEAGEEEADVNFFRNGRLFTAGFLVGQRQFTQGMSGLFQKDIAYGLYLSYFFNLKTALQFSYMTSSHAFRISPTVSGDIRLTHFAADLKYFFNTQNVTKGLASFNPYVLGGFSSINRETNRVGVTDFGQERAMAFDAGVGVEIPIGKRNDFYIGAQALYQLVNFKDENSNIIADGSPTNKFANGDLITLSAILGVNF